MEFQAQSFSLDISPENTKNVVYKDQEIAIDYELLKRNSIYFKQNDIKYRSLNNIQILEEEGNNIEFPLEFIRDFIFCCQNQKIEINSSNVFYLNYLSKKYKVQKLEKATLDIISNNERNLALDSLIFNLKISNNSAFADIETNLEETIIADDFYQYIKNEKIFQLPLPILYRIVQKYYTNVLSSNHVNNNSVNNNNSESDNEFVEFLFKLLDKFGKEASIFFMFFDIGKNRIKELIKLHDGYSDIFDPIYLNSSLMDTTVELIKEMIILKDEYTNESNQMKKLSESQNAQCANLKMEIETASNAKNQELLAQINELKGEISRMKNQQKSFELWQKIQNNQLDDIQSSLIPKRKTWEKLGNTNNFRLIDNNITYEVSASSTYSNNYFLTNLFNGEKEMTSHINSWATVANDSNAFVQIKFSIPKVVNILIFTARSASSQSPIHFEVFGIDNNDQGKSLGTFIQYNWNSGDIKMFPFFNEHSYPIYKINFYKSRSEYIALAELNLGQINL